MKLDKIIKLIIILAFCLNSFSGYAQDIDIAEKPSKKKEWKKPLVYTSSIMVIAYGVLVGTGEIEGSSHTDFEAAFRHGPIWANDSDFYDYVLHPLWGSEVYLRAREANFGKRGSFLFTLCVSTFWEFFIESWSQLPSQQDLMITPCAGLLLGELRYWLKQKKGKGNYWWIDPLHTFLEKVNIIPIEDSEGNIIPVVSTRLEF